MADSASGSLGEVRLQKLLAAAGVGSRRRCEDLIREGRVSVDGQVVRQLGARASPDAKLAVDGRLVGAAESGLYFAVNKPPGYVSTARDPQGRPTVLDLVPSDRRVYPVGRLDYDSEGLLLLTNDGALTQRLLHPSHDLEREYHVLVRGEITRSTLVALAEGVLLEGRPTAPARAALLRSDLQGAWLDITIREGRNRQVRRMCEAVGLVVWRLIRVRMGPLALGDLPLGRYRRLNPSEVRDLRR